MFAIISARLVGQASSSDPRIVWKRIVLSMESRTRSSESTRPHLPFFSANSCHPRNESVAQTEVFRRSDQCAQEAGSVANNRFLLIARLTPA